MSDWRLWTGGERPVLADTVVEVEFRGMPRAIVPAGRVNWSRKGDQTDVTSYRVVKDAPAAVPKQDPPPERLSPQERAAEAFASIVGERLPRWQVRMLAELIRLAEEAEKNG